MAGKINFPRSCQFSLRQMPACVFAVNDFESRFLPKAGRKQNCHHCQGDNFITVGLSWGKAKEAFRRFKNNIAASGYGAGGTKELLFLFVYSIKVLAINIFHSPAA